MNALIDGIFLMFDITYKYLQDQMVSTTLIIEYVVTQ